MAAEKASLDFRPYGSMAKCRSDLERTVNLFMEAVSGYAASALRRRIRRNSHMLDPGVLRGPVRASEK